MKQPTFTRPNFDALNRQPMKLAFVFSNGHVGILEGRCRGFGAISGEEEIYEESVGIYTKEGDYHNIIIDLRVKCAIPTFLIGEEKFYFPITQCMTICGKVDGETGVMIIPENN